MADASIAIAMKFYDEATAPMRRALQGIESHTARLAKAFNELTWYVRSWMASMAVGKITEWGRSFLDAAGQIERMREVLRGFVPDVKEMSRSLDYIFNLGSRVYGIDAIMDAFMKLKSVGVDPLDGSLKAIVDALIAFGQTSREHLNLAIIGFQQMMGKGVASMEELRRQISERIPSAMMILAEQLGISYQELTDRVGKGLVSAQEAWDAMIAGFQKRYGGTLERLSGLWELLSQRIKAFGVIFKSTFMEESGFLRRLEQDVGRVLDQLYGFTRSYTGKAVIADWAREVERSVYGIGEAFREVFGQFDGDDITRWLGWINDLAGGFSSILTPVIRDTVKTVDELSRALDKLGGGEGDRGGGMGILGELLGAAAVGGAASWGARIAGIPGQIGKIVAALAILNTELERMKKNQPDHWLTEWFYRFIPSSSDFAKAAEQIADALGWLVEKLHETQRAPAIEIPGYSHLESQTEYIDTQTVGAVDRLYSAMEQYADAGHDVGIVNQEIAETTVEMTKELRDALDAFKKVDEQLRGFVRGIQEDIRLIGLEGYEKEKAKAAIERDKELERLKDFYEQEKAVASTGLASMHEVRRQYEEARAAVITKYNRTVADINRRAQQDELDELKKFHEAKLKEIERVTISIEEIQTRAAATTTRAIYGIPVGGDAGILSGGVVNEMASSRYALEQSRITAAEEASKEFMEGVQDARSKMKDFGGLGEETFRTLENAVKRFGDQFTDTFTEMVTTGKASFSDLARSIIQDLIRITMYTTVTKPISNWLVGGIASLISGGIGVTVNNSVGAPGGGLFPNTSMDAGIITYGNRVVQRAEGGWLMEPIIGMGLRTGTTYTLAERGPELVVPQSKMGGTGQVNNVTVNVNVTNAGARTEVSGADAKGLGNAIKVAVLNVLAEQKRPGGMLNG